MKRHILQCSSQCITLTARRHQTHPLDCKTNTSRPSSTINNLILDGSTLLGKEDS